MEIRAAPPLMHLTASGLKCGHYALASRNLNPFRSAEFNVSAKRPLRVQCGPTLKPRITSVESLRNVETSQFNKRLLFSVQQATTDLQLKAASAVRAHSLSTPPPGRSEYSLQIYRAMKTEEEWKTLKLKTEGSLPEFPYTDCLVAVIHPAALESLDRDDPLRLIANLQPSCQMHGSPHSPYFVIGTLDLNLGPKLPGEDLVGDFPPVGMNTGHRRAYLSNVCVLQQARGKGVAASLIKETKQLAVALGVEELYAHVVIGNRPAERLYETAGFSHEKEENAQCAKASGRPRRRLLRLPLH
eukprot:jgi/Mesvir1/3660/Mv14951-RA.1